MQPSFSNFTKFDQKIYFNEKKNGEVKLFKPQRDSKVIKIMIILFIVCLIPGIDSRHHQAHSYLLWPFPQEEKGVFVSVFQIMSFYLKLVDT